jgi:hypothetical protein
MPGSEFGNPTTKRIVTWSVSGIEKCVYASRSTARASKLYQAVTCKSVEKKRKILFQYRSAQKTAVPQMRSMVTRVLEMFGDEGIVGLEEHTK